MALAGKYGQLLNAAANHPIGAIQASALGAGLLGAGGSVVGNLTDKEQGEGPLRIVSEALGAGELAVLPGALAGLSAAALGIRNQPGAMRAAVKAAGSAAPVRKINRKIAATGALSAAAIPVAAGLGGMIGGGGSNLYSAIGIPGFQPGINPESYGSSNTQAI